MVMVVLAILQQAGDLADFRTSTVVGALRAYDSALRIMDPWNTNGATPPVKWRGDLPTCEVTA